MELDALRSQLKSVEDLKEGQLKIVGSRKDQEAGLRHDRMELQVRASLSSLSINRLSRSGWWSCVALWALRVSVIHWTPLWDCWLA
jgi:hypothetical protein